MRKLALTAHITASVGWLGAVAAFLALAIVGLVSEGEQQVRGAYLAMDAITKAVILPLSLASLATGVIQGLGTPWGIFRHYWVVFKLVINLLATLLLLVHMQPVGHLAEVAAQGPVAGDEHRELQVQLLFDAAAAVVALVLATILSVYKPKGLTAHGRRTLRQAKASVPPAAP
jgi:hypothetical protein